MSEEVARRPYLAHTKRFIGRRNRGEGADMLMGNWQLLTTNRSQTARDVRALRPHLTHVSVGDI